MQGRRQEATSVAPDGAGLVARRIACSIVDDALRGRRTLDAALDAEHGDPGLGRLPERDRGFVKAVATETLRRLGQIRDALSRYMDRRPPKSAGRIEAILAVGACQILFLDTPTHAAVDLAVRLAGEDRGARHYKGLVNAVLRRLAADAGEVLSAQDAAALNTPAWLRARWADHYAEEGAAAIAAAHLELPPLDLTAKDDAAGWAARLGGTLLPTGSIRLAAPGAVAGLAGFAEGAWWVQDAAAALPARLLGEVRGQRIADLCAAPGGKTAQLAAAGAEVVAVERSPSRLRRLEANLARLGLRAVTVEADAATWRPGAPFDAVLLDAPCTATGTLRRHPDIAWVRRPGELSSLVALQRQLIENALAMLRPGGTLVYAVCSLEPEEGVEQIERLLAQHRVRRVPIAPAEIGGLERCLSRERDLRTLPFHSPGAPGGMDGFYAARLMVE